MLFLGLDLGTQGVRSVVTDENGNIIGSTSCPYESLNIGKDGYFEQAPAAWWNSTIESVKLTICKVKENGHSADEIYSMAVDATAPTVLAVDKDGNPLTNGIMYNDNRGFEFEELARKYAGEYEKKHGLKINGFNGICKMLWIRHKCPEVYKHTYKLLGQASYIVGKLSGNFDSISSPDALRIVADAFDNIWPAFYEKCGIAIDKLPKIYDIGEIIGTVSKSAGKELGLSENTKIVAGTTDAYASVISTGACKIGDWTSVLGTTVVIKGATKDVIDTGTGATYSYRFPGGKWFLSGASNVGGRCLNMAFDTKRFKELDEAITDSAPSDIICYPLIGVGERYPFANKNVIGFAVDTTDKENALGRDLHFDENGNADWDSVGELRHYKALLEGVGYTERLAYELNEKAGCIIGDTILASGGGAKSEVWLQIRADILNRSMKVPALPDAAFGMAMVAALPVLKSMEQIAAQMVKYTKLIKPNKKNAEKYDILYKKFREECKKRFGI